MVLDTFKKILRMKQEDLKLTCLKYLIAKNYEIQYGDGFVYGKGDIPVMLVAHMDTVHTNIPYKIYYDKEEDIMWSPQGIGGDDRCGVYSIMEILKEYKPYVLFLEDEEIGSIGANKAVKKINIPQINFIIELDRRGINDCVFYECGNEKFQNYIESFGFETKIGSFTDIVTLSEAWQMASVNLSIGYFSEHTTNETISLNIMQMTIDKVKNILEDVKKHPDDFYEYDCVYPYYKYSTYDDYYKEEKNEEIEEIEEIEDDIKAIEKKIEEKKEVSKNELQEKKN